MQLLSLPHLPEGSYNFEDRVWWDNETLAVVTGGNKGIGKEICRHLAREGLTVILAARSPECGRAAVAELTKDPKNRVIFRQLDIANPDSIDAFKTWLEAEYGGLTILVNNAGVAYKGTFGIQELCSTLDTNYHGTAALTEALLPLLANPQVPGQARIVTMSSSAGYSRIIRNQELREKFLNATGKPQLDRLLGEFMTFVSHENFTGMAQAGWPRSIYGISKLAISMYSRQLAHIVESDQIKVAVCCPGWCVTDMSSQRGLKTPAEGADTPVWLALQPAEGFKSGLFWTERHAVQC